MSPHSYHEHHHKSSSNQQKSSRQLQHHHHHQHRRRRHHYHRHGHDHHHHHGGSSNRYDHRHHHDTCPRRHRSHTDISTTSINTCHDSCPDHEVREILIKRPCCSTSKTELVQYFIEDLYGTGRRTSCCTSSDYCYHTDSTSLYGSRSSLSRNNSIRSGSGPAAATATTTTTIRRKKIHHRQPSYGSLSLGRLNHSHPNSLLGSLTSIFDKTRDTGSGKMIVSPSKVTIEHQSKNISSSAKDLPEYACSPSPIRWSFLADSESKTPSDFDGGAVCPPPPVESRSEGHSHHGSNGSRKFGSGGDRDHHRSSRSCSSSIKYRDGGSPLNTCRDGGNRGGGGGGGSGGCIDSEESTTVVFHQEGEAFNNCCNNYLQCNAFLDQDLQITSEDICVYLSKGNKGEILNNSINYPFQPSTALEFQYKNNFTASSSSSKHHHTNNNDQSSSEFRRFNNKETNLNQNLGEQNISIINNNNNAAAAAAAVTASSSLSSTPLSPTNINLSSSSNNINIIFNSYLDHNPNEVKFINTSRESASQHHYQQQQQYYRHHYRQDESHDNNSSYPGPPPTSSRYNNYPNCDNTNMSSSSLFEKPLGIDEIPPSSTGPLSSSYNLPAGVSGGVGSGGGGSGDTLETSSSHHNLLYYRYSSYSDGQQSFELSTASISPRRRHHSSHHSSHRRWHHVTDNLKITNALRRVRKRARKCAQYLRKK